MSDNQKNLISVALIIILGFAVYSNSLNGKFLWDDNSLIKENIYIKSYSHLPKIFSKDIGAGIGRKYYFLPSTTNSYLCAGLFSLEF